MGDRNCDTRSSMFSRPQGFCYPNRELTDELMRLRDEHTQLKKQAQASENRIKLLSTRLMRAMNTGRSYNSSIVLQELVQDLHNKIIHFEKENTKLRQRCTLLRTKLSGAVRGNTAYANVRAKTDTGINGRRSTSSVTMRPTPTYENKGLRAVAAVATEAIKSGARLPADLMRQIQDELKRLDEIMIMTQTPSLPGLNNQLSYIERSDSVETCSLKILDKESIHFSDVGNSKNPTMKPDEVERFAKKVDTTPSFVEETADQEVIENFHRDLLETRAKEAASGRSLVTSSISEAQMAELKQKSAQLSEENNILRESLEKCIGSCLTQFNPASHLSVRVSQLENEKSSLEKSLAAEKVKFEVLSKQYQNLQTLYDSLAQIIISSALAGTNAAILDDVVTPSTWSEDATSSPSHLKSYQIEVKSANEPLKDRIQALQRERDYILEQFSDVRLIMDLFQSNINK